jgi:hypothetical protein
VRFVVSVVVSTGVAVVAAVGLCGKSTCIGAQPVPPATPPNRPGLRGSHSHYRSDYLSASSSAVGWPGIRNHFR